MQKRMVKIYCHFIALTQAVLSKVSYNKISNNFIINDIEHIESEKHSYIIPKIVKEKYINILIIVKYINK